MVNTPVYGVVNIPVHGVVNVPVGAASRRDYVQDERYIAIEHMEVRRDCFSFAHGLKNRGETPLLHQ